MLQYGSRATGGTVSIAASSSSTGSDVPKTIFGYDVVSRIGYGAASALYAVTDATGQLFALKHVIRRTEVDERFLQQLQNEYDVSQKFRHPVLRKAIDWKVPRRFFSNKFNEAALVLEWVDGQPLDQQPPTELHDLMNVFLQAAAGLASLHKLLLVHCDFKPHNMLVCEGLKVKLIDFGQACKTGTVKPRVQGTPDYMAPEQVKCMALDARTDIYNFGAALYWALTGRKAPTYMTVDRKERSIVKEQKFPKPREVRPELPEELSALVMQCLMYNPENRISDMAKLMAVLSPLAQPPAAPPPAAAAPPPPPPAPEPPVKKPARRVVKDWGI